MRNPYFTTKKRLLAVIIAAAFLFGLLSVRLAYIQLIQGEELRAKAADQWTRDLPLTPLRGDILSSDGEVLATSITSYTVYIRAKNVTDPKFVAEVLSVKLDLSYEGVYRKATNKGVSEVTVKRQVDAGTAVEIREYSLSGVYFGADSTRQYNYNDFLSQVLGFVSIDNAGQSGIEEYYDKYLKGIEGSILTQSDLIGIELEDEPIYYIPSIPGLNVVLTIDSKIQHITESALNLAMKVHNPKRASAIVMDVTNGDILAMGIKPGIDLNNLPRDDTSSLMEYSRNVLLTDVYEPGSTFKILTAAASLEEYKKGNSRAFSDTHVFKNNSASRTVDGGAKISCWRSHADGKHDNQNLSMALNNSCNPIFTDIALSLGKSTMYDYIEAFGYGSTTGIDYTGEQSGILISESLATVGDLARIGFGQSIAVTAIQLACATAAAVNGGYLYEPRLVKQVTDKDDNLVMSFYPKVKSRPISSDTSAKLAKMLEDVVTIGSGKNAYIEGYEVGGKTGTAQKFENGKIAEGKYVSSFVGFFPASNPKYLALVVVDEPEGMSYGSMVAAPYAKLIFEQIIFQKKMSPILK